jgi:predicted MFS family arabinose efflux permease
LGLLRVFHALGYVAFTTAGTALVIQLTPEGQRGSRLAIFGAAANVAITATPAATTWLLEVAPLWTGFAASAGLAAVAGAMALTIHSPDRASAGNVAVASWRVGRNVLLSMLAAGLFGLVFAAFFLFAPILSERRAVPPGALYTVYGVGIILTRFVAGPWLDRLGVARTLLISLAPIVSGLLLAGFGHDVMVLGLAAFLLAVGGGLFHPALLAHHARLMPDTPGRATAAFYLGFDLGIGLGSWLLGFVLDGFGLTALYLVAAVLALAALPLVRVIARRS